MTTSSLLQKWATHVCNKEMNSILNLYHTNFYIKPTLYDWVINKDKFKLEDYFKHFLGKNDITRVEFSGTHTQNYGYLIMDMGNYRFWTKNNNYFDANYTFIHDNEYIFIHHSSHFN
jgi:hypothetical protein